MKNIKIALIGSTGLLGQSIVKAGVKNNINISEFSRADTEDLKGLESKLIKINPCLLICTIAIPSNRQCLEKPAEALLSNLLVPMSILKIALRLNIRSIIFSSHGVFPGNPKLEYYRDVDIPEPNTFYGLLKGNLEMCGLDLMGDSLTVIRLPSLYGYRKVTEKVGLCERLISEIRLDLPIKARNNLYDSYTCSDDVAEYLLQNIDLISKRRIVHIANTGIASLFEFSIKARDFLKSSSIVDSLDFNSSTISCNSLENSFFDGVIQPQKWDDALKSFLNKNYGK
jgi:dTDP-4-dehydrorhamnose reductase